MPDLPPERFAGTVFPPADVSPMVERTAKPGDGKWQAMAEGTRASGSVMFRTEVHPHKFKPFVFVTIVAFDRRHVDINLVEGIQEPVSKNVPAEKRTGLVPSSDYASLLVVFNGGFKAAHGRYGMMLDGDIYVPPKDDACTVALHTDGGVRIGSWPVIAPTASTLRGWRQTPPCLVEQGVVNERLKNEFRTRKWGAAAGGDREIRRSAIGLDQSGRTLFYGFGDWVTAGDIAAAMSAAGAHDAAQLDINWSYTRFFTFDHPTGSHDGAAPPRIAGSIVPKAKWSPNRYISKPSYRDFFYLTADP